MAQTERQLGFVIDLNKCMGCQTCTVTCKVFWTNDKGMDHMWWMRVNTMPGRGYPKDWEKMGGGYDGGGKLVLGKRATMEDLGGVMQFNYEEAFYGGKGPQVHLAPKQKPTWGPNWDEDIGAGEYPNAYFFYLPRLCNHCGKPACAEACPFQAITKRAEDGVVLIDGAKCAQCQEPVCMAGCPYKVIFSNDFIHAAQKCNGCLPRIEQEVAPACVRQCPGRCIWVDFLDNEEGTVDKLVRKWKVALPLHPKFNTKPNVYYIPPLAPPRLDEDGNIDESETRIPMEYLRSLFGEGVDQALATLRQEMGKRRKVPKEPSELMDLLIARSWKEILGPFPKDPSEVEAGPQAVR
jgi:ethylbenzene hydroxylase subunit beta/complex iron-sulfur molybdoenzyme family reductase subunit beta